MEGRSGTRGSTTGGRGSGKQNSKSAKRKASTNESTLPTASTGKKKSIVIKKKEGTIATDSTKSTRKNTNKGTSSEVSVTSNKTTVDITPAPSSKKKRAKKRRGSGDATNSNNLTGNKQVEAVVVQSKTQNTKRVSTVVLKRKALTSTPDVPESEARPMKLRKKKTRNGSNSSVRNKLSTTETLETVPSNETNSSSPSLPKKKIVSLNKRAGATRSTSSIGVSQLEPMDSTPPQSIQREEDATISSSPKVEIGSSNSTVKEVNRQMTSLPDKNLLVESKQDPSLPEKAMSVKSKQDPSLRDKTSPVERKQQPSLHDKAFSVESKQETAFRDKPVSVVSKQEVMKDNPHGQQDAAIDPSTTGTIPTDKDVDIAVDNISTSTPPPDNTTDLLERKEKSTSHFDEAAVVILPEPTIPSIVEAALSLQEDEALAVSAVPRSLAPLSANKKSNNIKSKDKSVFDQNLSNEDNSVAISDLKAMPIPEEVEVVQSSQKVELHGSNVPPALCSPSTNKKCDAIEGKEALLAQTLSNVDASVAVSQKSVTMSIPELLEVTPCRQEVEVLVLSTPTQSPRSAQNFETSNNATVEGAMENPIDEELLADVPTLLDDIEPSMPIQPICIQEKMEKPAVALISSGTSGEAISISSSRAFPVEQPEQVIECVKVPEMWELQGSQVSTNKITPDTVMPSATVVESKVDEELKSVVNPPLTTTSVIPTQMMETITPLSLSNAGLTNVAADIVMPSAKERESGLKEELKLDDSSSPGVAKRMMHKIAPSSSSNAGLTNVAADIVLPLAKERESRLDEELKLDDSSSLTTTSVISAPMVDKISPSSTNSMVTFQPVHCIQPVAEPLPMYEQTKKYSQIDEQNVPPSATGCQVPKTAIELQATQSLPRSQPTASGGNSSQVLITGKLPTSIVRAETKEAASPVKVKLEVKQHDGLPCSRSQTIAKSQKASTLKPNTDIPTMNPRLSPRDQPVSNATNATLTTSRKRNDLPKITSDAVVNVTTSPPIETKVDLSKIAASVAPLSVPSPYTMLFGIESPKQHHPVQTASSSQQDNAASNQLKRKWEHAWGSSFGVFEMTKEPTNESRSRTPRTPLSSWFFSQGPANFKKRVVIPPAQAPSSHTRKRSPQHLRVTVPSKDGACATPCSSEFLQDLVSKSSWRTWYGNIDENDLLDPPLPHEYDARVQQIEQIYQSKGLDDALENEHDEVGNNLSSRKRSLLVDLEKTIEVEKKRSKVFSNELLQLMKGKTLNGQDLKKEFAELLSSNRIDP